MAQAGRASSSSPSLGRPGVARPGYSVRTARASSRPGSGASKDIECSDHGYAQEREQEAEQGACREPGQGQLESPSDGYRTRRVKGFAEQPVTARVLPNRVERQGRRIKRDAIKGDRGR